MAGQDEPKIEFVSRIGKINSDLTVGVDVTKVRHLLANESICHDGVKLHGRGFIVTPAEAEHLGLGTRPELEKYIRTYRNGRDLAQASRGKLVIDLFGLELADVRSRFPEVYQHLLDSVKSERDRVFAKSGSKDSEGYAKLWWLFGKPRQELRPAIAGLSRHIATVDTARHRIFQFLSTDIVCDDKVVLVALDDGYALGILQSNIHLVWAIRAGGWLGVGNDPVYVKTKVFDPFPFPSPGELLKSQIRAAAEELDAFRKQRQKEHPSLTLTQMYNVLEKLKAIEAAQRTSSSPPGLSRGSTTSGASASEDMDGRDKPGHDEDRGTLTADEERVKDEGLILILKELHEKLDRLVFQAYGWPQTLSDEQILEKLVALNHERAAEEKRGQVHWLRPDYQIPRFGKDLDKQAAKEEGAQIAAELEVKEAASQKPAFPSDAVDQTAVVFEALLAASGPRNAAALAATFRQGKRIEKKVAEVLSSLARLGHIVTRDGKTYDFRRAA